MIYITFEKKSVLFVKKKNIFCLDRERGKIMFSISVSGKMFLRTMMVLAVIPGMVFSAPAVGTARMKVGTVERWKAKQDLWKPIGNGAKVYQTDKVRTGEESAQCRGCLEARVASAGFTLVSERGDAPGFPSRT